MTKCVALTSHSTHNGSFQRWVISEMSLYRQSTALVLTTKNNQTQHYIHQKHKTNTTALANSTIYTLTWYAFHDLRPEGPGPILTAPEPNGTEHLQINFNSKPTLNRNIHDWLTGSSWQEILHHIYITDQTKYRPMLRHSHILKTRPTNRSNKKLRAGFGHVTVTDVRKTGHFHYS